MIISVASFPAASYGGASPSAFHDIKNHWAKEKIEEAFSNGWIGGYGDGTFRPERSVTRAEFVKMLESAMKLTPDSTTAQFLMKATEDYRTKNTLNGVRNHWIERQGFINPALAYGLIVPSDYMSRNFGPDTPITRKEIVIMLDRMLGLVASAEKEKGISLSFKDNKEIPDWLKGYIDQAVSKNIITGYEDGTFRYNRGATRAEAVAMIQNALSYMDNGIVNDYKISVNGQAASLSVPVQIIDGMAYVPAKDIISAANKDLSFGWDPIRQKLTFYWVFYFTLMPDRTVYQFDYLYCMDFPAKARMLNGQIMYPIGNYYADQNNYYLGNLWIASWDKEAKVIDIEARAPIPPNPS